MGRGAWGVWACTSSCRVRFPCLVTETLRGERHGSAPRDRLPFLCGRRVSVWQVLVLLLLLLGWCTVRGLVDVDVSPVVLPSSVLGEYFSVSRAQHSPGKPTKRRKRKREEKGGGGIPQVQFSGSSSRMNCMCAAAESSTEKNQQTLGARCASADLSSNENPMGNGPRAEPRCVPARR